jgi:hypothetical protein
MVFAYSLQDFMSWFGHTIEDVSLFVHFTLDFHRLHAAD